MPKVKNNMNSKLLTHIQDLNKKNKKSKKFVGLSNHNIFDLMQELDITVEDLKPGVESAIENLMDALCIDWRNDHNSKDTPRRVAKMFLTETMVGRYTEQPKLTEFPNVSNLDQLIIIGPIRIESMCSHHLQNIRGNCWVGVLPKPDGKIIGLSKFSRLVRWYTRRPQIQEELTVNIGEHLKQLLDPVGIGVVIHAEHECMSVRGVEEPGTLTKTHWLDGAMREWKIRDEFLSQIK